MRDGTPLRGRIEAAIADWDVNEYPYENERDDLIPPRGRLPRPVEVVLSSEFANLAFNNLGHTPGNFLNDLDTVRQWLCCRATKKEVAKRLSPNTPYYPPLKAASFAVWFMLRSVFQEKSEANWQGQQFCVDSAAHQAHICCVLASKRAMAYSAAESIARKQREQVSHRYVAVMRAFLTSQLRDGAAFALLEDYEAGDYDARGAWYDRITENGVAAALSSSVAEVFVI